MKFIKKRLFSLKSFLLLILLLLTIASIFIAGHIDKTQEDSKSILEQQRFIVVDSSINGNLYRYNFENGYDLKNENFYSTTQVVVKNGKKYGSY